jgi:hypothetical protein
MKTQICKITAVVIGALAANWAANAQNALDKVLPIRGLAIAAPSARQIDSFVTFINEELAPRQVNTLILRVDYNYQYESHPELRDGQALTKADVKKLVQACQAHQIRIIPQINLLGHQSWAGTTHNLLRQYPEFDETPWVKMPQKYAWPNPDKLYCKSYCPLHPKVHEVVFPLIDEICDAFETDAFHAGMDEVFYIGEAKCPRCGGKDPADLFAGEVKLIRDHLAEKGRKLWIWGDRLLDGKTMGLGEWEGSINGTFKAIDLIPKDVVICDWHYERADQTAIYFALKGLQVVTCPWRNPQNAILQVQDMIQFRKRVPPVVKGCLAGVVQTVWSGASGFMNELAAVKKGGEAPKNTNTPARCFVKMYDEILKHQEPSGDAPTARGLLPE